MKHIVGFVGSPQRESNSGILMQRFMQGVKDAGAEMQIYHLNSIKALPCKGCGFCRAHDYCSIEDDLTPVLRGLPQVDGVVIASPIYFYQVNGITKNLIDRCYSLVNNDFTHRLGSEKRAMMIYCQGNVEPMAFEASFKINAEALRCVGLNVTDTLVAYGLQQHGEVSKRKEFLEDAYKLGGKMVK